MFRPMPEWASAISFYAGLIVAIILVLWAVIEFFFYIFFEIIIKRITVWVNVSDAFMQFIWWRRDFKEYIKGKEQFAKFSDMMGGDLQERGIAYLLSKLSTQQLANLIIGCKDAYRETTLIQKIYRHPDFLNAMIKSNEIDTNKISDGYHTFGELYDHRIMLYIALCSVLKEQGEKIIWRSNKHSDGSVWEGWFLLGIGNEHGKQITYHLPSELWPICGFADTLEQAPEFDGHTSNDVLNRVQELIEEINKW